MDFPFSIRYVRQIECVVADFQIKETGEGAGCEEFDGEIADGERMTAGAAPAAEKPVTEERDVVGTRMGWKQWPQCEPGQRMLFSNGKRATQTLMKLPTMAPRTITNPSQT